MRARKDDQAYDSYAREVAVSEKRSDTARDLEIRLARTTRMLAMWEAPESVEESWEEKRKAQFRSGDYRSLVAALKSLEETHPNRVRLWVRSIVYQEPLSLTPAAKQALAETTEMLLERMPLEIRVPRHLEPRSVNQARKESLWRGRTSGHGQQRSQREEEILHQRFELGWSLQRIARHHFLTRQRVHQIVSQASAVR